MVGPRAVTQCRTTAGITIYEPGPRAVVFAGSILLPAPNNTTPLNTVRRSVSGCQCNGIVYASGSLSRSVYDESNFFGSPSITATCTLGSFGVGIHLIASGGINV